MILPDDVVPDAYRIAITPHAEQATFDGRVEIDVEVRRRTDRIVIDSADLQIDGATLSGESRAPRIVLDAPGQRVSFAFDHPLSLGRHTLRIAYSGKIFDQPAALFKLTHATPAGPVVSLFTQFEDSDARRFVPSWDEPARRATFELTATVPDDQVAVGNMPIVASEALAGHLKRVRFAPTPRMSTYLLFFGLGDFERVHREVDGVDVGIVVKRGDTARAAYALDAAAALLPFYDDWFGTPYPLPKMDMIAGAGESAAFGAMENWGAIFYFEHDLLIDPERAGEDDRQRVFQTVAHEVAHQWFGDLVTMAWWDDLWLNEGFATWMQTKAADHLHPEWHAWAQTAVDKQSAFDLDARRGTHPVILKIDAVSQTEGAFDTITYSKGSQVVRTLEAYAGADVFRDGVRRYLTQHAYGNTTSDDLWQALDAGSGRPVRTIARDLTLQPGVPLITELDATCTQGRTDVTLAQGQFALDDTGAARRRHTPVALRVLGGGRARAVIFGPAPQHVSVDGCGPLVINPGQPGYFRTRYSAAGLAALTARFAQLDIDDQLGLLSDTYALALGGQLPMGTALDVLRQVPADVDPLVADAVVAQLTDLDLLHEGLPTRPALRAFARSLLNPIFARVGWQAGPGQNVNTRTLRADLIEALGTFDDAAVVAEAGRRFHQLAGRSATPAGRRRARRGADRGRGACRRGRLGRAARARAGGHGQPRKGKSLPATGPRPRLRATRPRAGAGDLRRAAGDDGRGHPAQRRRQPPRRDAGRSSRPIGRRSSRCSARAPARRSPRAASTARRRRGDAPAAGGLRDGPCARGGALARGAHRVAHPLPGDGARRSGCRRPTAGSPRHPVAAHDVRPVSHPANRALRA